MLPIWEYLSLQTHQQIRRTIFLFQVILVICRPSLRLNGHYLIYCKFLDCYWLKFTCKEKSQGLAQWSGDWAIPRFPRRERDSVPGRGTRGTSCTESSHGAAKGPACRNWGLAQAKKGGDFKKEKKLGISTFISLSFFFLISWSLAEKYIKLPEIFET